MADWCSMAKAQSTGQRTVGGNELCNYGYGNVGCGIWFKLTKPRKAGEAWTENDSASLSRRVMTEWQPNGGLIFDAKGSLYGPPQRAATSAGTGWCFV